MSDPVASLLSDHIRSHLILSHRMPLQDDTEEALKSRLEAYHAQTLPLLAHYEKWGVVQQIEANRPQEEVWESIAITLPEPRKKAQHRRMTRIDVG